MQYGGMRDRRRRAVPILIATALILMITGCALGPSRSLPTVQPGTTDRWTVSVSQPRFHGDETCSSDASVDNAILSADMPASRLGITLKAGSLEEDAVRVAECLLGVLQGGEISILSPRSP